MNLIETKILVAVLFLVIRCTFGIIPIKLYKWIKSGQQQVINESRREKIEFVIALVQAFGGGVLFATCFLHMMPEVTESVQELKKYRVLDAEYPYSQLVISMGFFTVYFAEELSNWLISKTPKEPYKRPSKIGPKNGNAFVIPCSLQNDVMKDVKNESDFEDVDEEVVQVENIKNLEAVDEEVQTENDNAFQNLENNLELDPEVIKEIDEIIEEEVITQQQVLRCFLMVLALSFHALFEGLAIGLQQNLVNIWYLFVAVAIHSATILFCMGLEIVLAGTKAKTTLIHVAMLSTTSPLGVLLGLIITVTTNLHTGAKSFAIVLFLGVSSGTILYITFFETLSREKNRRTSRLARAFSIGFGFTLMALLKCLKL